VQGWRVGWLLQTGKKVPKANNQKGGGGCNHATQILHNHTHRLARPLKRHQHPQNKLRDPRKTKSHYETRQIRNRTTHQPAQPTVCRPKITCTTPNRKATRQPITSKIQHNLKEEQERIKKVTPHPQQSIIPLIYYLYLLSYRIICSQLYISYDLTHTSIKAYTP
jgi:hypothetical protein